MNVNDRTLLDLDRLEELADGELALVRHEGVTDDGHAIPFRIMQDVVDDVWTVVVDDYVDRRQMQQIMGFLPDHVVLYDTEDNMGVTTMTWLGRQDAVLCQPTIFLDRPAPSG